MVKNEKLKSILQFNKYFSLPENISKYRSEFSKHLPLFIDRIKILKKINEKLKDGEKRYQIEGDIGFLKRISEKTFDKDLKRHIEHTVNFLENLKRQKNNLSECSCKKKEFQNLHEIEEEVKENYEPEKLCRYINETLKVVISDLIKGFESQIAKLKKDALTHAWIRICLHDDLKNIVKNLEVNRKEKNTKNKKLFIAIIDSDKLKQINDRFGHSAGDIVIEKISEIIRKSIRKSGRVYRYGGDEFVLIIEAKDENEFLKVCEKIREKIGKTKIKLDNGEYVNTTVSIGATRIKSKNIKNLLKTIDRNLYRAKKMGGNRVIFS